MTSERKLINFQPAVAETVKVKFILNCWSENSEKFSDSKIKDSTFENMNCSLPILSSVNVAHSFF